MKSLKARCTKAPGQETNDLEALARQQLEEAGFARPSEKAVQTRVATLARDQGMKSPGAHGVASESQRVDPKYSPSLGVVQAICQQAAHQSELRARTKRQGTCEVQGEGKLPYYFAALPDEYVDCFMRYLPDSAGVLLWALWRYSKSKMQTWVSQKTLCKTTGSSLNTVKRDLRLLQDCNIIARAPAGGQDFHGKEIKKRQGFKYHLTLPVAWDRAMAENLQRRHLIRRRDRG